MLEDGGVVDRIAERHVGERDLHPGQGGGLGDRREELGDLAEHAQDLVWSRLAEVVEDAEGARQRRRVSFEVDGWLRGAARAPEQLRHLDLEARGRELHPGLADTVDHADAGVHVDSEVDVHVRRCRAPRVDHVDEAAERVAGQVAHGDSLGAEIFEAERERSAHVDRGSCPERGLEEAYADRHVAEIGGIRRNLQSESRRQRIVRGHEDERGPAVHRVRDHSDVEVALDGGCQAEADPRIDLDAELLAELTQVRLDAGYVGQGRLVQRHVDQRFEVTTGRRAAPVAGVERQRERIAGRGREVVLQGVERRRQRRESAQARLEIAGDRLDLVSEADQRVEACADLAGVEQRQDVRELSDVVFQLGRKRRNLVQQLGDWRCQPAERDIDTLRDLGRLTDRPGIRA